MQEAPNPEQSYRDEIEAALSADNQRIGDVFRSRGDDTNKSAQNIADELGIGTVGSIYSVLNSIETLLQCRRLSGGPTYASQRASMLRSFSKRHAQVLSDTTRQRLLDLASEHDMAARDAEAIAEENAEIEREVEAGTQGAEPGIYVYTYPHYMRFPVVSGDDDDTNPRTYLKVGMSETDMAQRIKAQITTAMPEPPLILRMYSVSGGDIGEIEARLHEHLNAADHNRLHVRGAGREWFLTHLRFIDSTASLLGLRIIRAHDSY